jgi:hypothetical protein
MSIDMQQVLLESQNDFGGHRHPLEGCIDAFAVRSIFTAASKGLRLLCLVDAGVLVEILVRDAVEGQRRDGTF